MTQKKKCVLVFAAILLVFFLSAGIIYWVGKVQLEAVTRFTAAVSPTANVNALAGTNTLEQQFKAETDTLDEVRLFVGNFGTPKTGTFTLSIWEGETCLWQKDFDAATISHYQMNAYPIRPQIEDVKNKILQLRIDTVEVPEDQAITFYYGNTVELVRGHIETEIESPLSINGHPADGKLCMEMVGRDLLRLKAFYWPGALLLAGVFSAAYWIGYRKWQEGQKCLFKSVVDALKYEFLLTQLVVRDFKTRYKRSVLGVLWSVLNPLLTMLVQYLVFSSLFSSSIPNFIAYLMCGGVMFNFFSESVTLGLGSIVYNAPLINKVYVPKAVFPVSRVLSSAINLLFAMIPLLLIVLLSGIRLHKSILLLPLVIVYIILFAIGISLIFASSMVFFRDTQFLWGVLSTLWMYMTPIFYPDTIIPQQFLWLYHMNPMYQFIYFLREIVINGQAPGPLTFLFCTLCALIPLTIGILIFKKTQDRFVLYL